VSPQRSISWKALLLTIFWLSVFIATHLPKVPRAIGKVSDKTLHFAAFAILGYLLTWVLFSRHREFVRLATLVLAIIAIYGAVDELLQIPVGRRCDFWDWVADMIGAAVGLGLFHFARFLKQRYYVGPT
jgi:VanZ family protein